MQNRMEALLYMQVLLYVEEKLEHQKLNGCFWLTLLLVDSTAITKSAILFPVSISITGGIKCTVLYACLYLKLFWAA